MENVTETTAERPASKPVPSRQRSRVTNGSVLLHGVDQRSPWVRRCRDLIVLHEADLGGADNASIAERSIVRRAAVLTTELEQLETQFALNGSATPEALDLYSRVASSLRRLLESVGLQRRSRDVTPTLSDYLRQEEAEQRRAAAAAAPIEVVNEQEAT